ncbi:hypothetical protein CFB40_08815 [Burkholderia sp. AU31652]|uniref:hypothetical protein n=1 Tax=Burkholderia sp. AU31652 TaxID=2015354 RepID=UPI000B91F320|nr:hypothetical protein [Burkholderia sp. AU31652]OXI90446.1 hypothetical protein CFB40_08815 [Burkholderia sp. AU31652]
MNIATSARPSAICTKVGGLETTETPERSASVRERIGGAAVYGRAEEDDISLKESQLPIVRRLRLAILPGIFEMMGEVIFARIA